ncbi:transposase, IS481 family [Bordetella pertussis STO1-CHOC-0018]|nr:transposase, IS481 family [Bordetella pertussis STO1-CHOC-0018]
MNTHKHARLTFLRRLEMVQQLIAHQVCVPEAARAYGVTAPTVRKWLGRFLAQGQAGLADASSRPTVSPRAIAPAKALAIVELRRKRLTQARIAQALGVSASTVSRVLARAGLSHLADLEPAEPVVRYEHQAPGDLLHIDIKKLGRIQRPGHRVTGNRRDTVEGAGWDFVFVAIDDHARVAFTDIHPDERFPSAVQFLKDAVAYYQRLGVTIQRLLTDNGSAFRSRAFAALCHELGIKHRFTRPYRPQTNGKAERFIQSALREWAYAHTYQNSQHRADAMKSWLHHYNWHRPHQEHRHIVLHDAAYAHGIADARQLALRIQQHDGHVAAIDARQHDQAFAGLVDEAGLRDLDVPVGLAHQQVGVAERLGAVVDLDLVLGVGRIAVDQRALRGGAQHAGQVARRGHVLAGQAGGLDEARVQHAQRTRLGVHGGDEGRHAARIVAAQRVGGAVFRGHQRQVQHVAAAEHRAHAQARSGVLERIDIIVGDLDHLVHRQGGVPPHQVVCLSVSTSSSVISIISSIGRLASTTTRAVISLEIEAIGRTTFSFLANSTVEVSRSCT